MQANQVAVQVNDVGEEAHARRQRHARARKAGTRSLCAVHCGVKQRRSVQINQRTEIAEA